MTEQDAKLIYSSWILLCYKFHMDYGRSEERKEQLDKLYKLIGNYTNLSEFKKTIFKNELDVLDNLNYMQVLGHFFIEI